MTNIALIIAGGVGTRMGQDIPKQFINVYDKPIIVYTMEVFQKHPEIDAIEVVCLDGWFDVVRAYARQFGIAKLENIVVGGENGQDSIRNGLLDIADRYNDNEDIVLIHDAIRPMLSFEIISDSIKVCREYGMQLQLYLVQLRCLKHMIHFLRKNKFHAIILKLHKHHRHFF